MDQLIKPRVTRRIHNIFISMLLSRLPRCIAYIHTANRIMLDAMFYIVNSCFARRLNIKNVSFIFASFPSMRCNGSANMVFDGG